ncbi:MAG: leucine-rich repeat protein [Bacteroidaceae bacterium]|nr:leucine-rich repeat protein [Bacteroidaceae bacterium]
MKTRNLFLLIMAVLFCGSQKVSAAWDVSVGETWYGYIIHFDTFGQYAAQIKSIEPFYLGMGTYNELEVPETYVASLFAFAVQAIGQEACKGLTELKKVTFQGSSLKYINPSAFEGCTGLTSIDLPNSVKYIYANAFAGCTGLTEVRLPNNIAVISSNIFNGCSSLRSIISDSYNPVNISSNGSSSFNGLPDDCVLHIPYGMESVYAERGWTTDIFKGGIVAETTFTKDNVTYRVTGSNTVEVIGCTAEGYVNIPASVSLYTTEWTNYDVTALAEGAFEGNTGLTSITLPSTITSFGDRAFSGCTGLTSFFVTMTTAPTVTASVFEGIVKANCKLYVPKDMAEEYSDWARYFVTVVDGETFTETINGVETTFLITGETTVQLGDGAVAIPTDYSGAYVIPETVEHDGVTYNVTELGRYAFNQCTSLTSVTLPEAITKIGARAFSGCSSLSSVQGMDNVTIIDQGAFAYCSSLQEIHLPEGLSIIARQAFTYSGLAHLEIPSTLTAIYVGAFKFIPTLTSVRSKLMNPVGITDAFEGVSSNCILTIPQGTTQAYRDALWSGFFSSVVEDGILYGTTVEGVRFAAMVIEGNDVKIYASEVDDLGDESPIQVIDTNTEGTVTLPSSFDYLGQTYYVKEIGGYAFMGCKKITSVTIPEGVTSIGKWAFVNCENLESVSLPSTLTIIGDDAFYNCNLSAVALPENLTTISRGVFRVNKNLTTIMLPRSLQSIGYNVFSGTNLLSVLSPITDPFELPSDNEGAFWPDQTKDNPVILTVPYGTKQRYLDRGWKQREGSENHAFYKVVEEQVDMNHTFLQVGEGAKVLVSYEDPVSGSETIFRLQPNKASQAYLHTTNCADAYFYVQVQDGYTYTLLRNGEEFTGATYNTNLEGEDYTLINFIGDDINDEATWQIVVTPTDSGSSTEVNVGDVNQDGSITIADVTALVNIILGKTVVPGPISDVTLDCNVVMKPDANYTQFYIPVSDRLVNAFRLTASQIASKLLNSPAEPQNGQIELVSYNADGIPYSSYTAVSGKGEIGYWYDADGYPMNWSTETKLALYFDKNAQKFAVILHPQTSSGLSVNVKQALIYKDNSGKTVTATINFHVTVDEVAENSATFL